MVAGGLEIDALEGLRFLVDEPQPGGELYTMSTEKKFPPIRLTLMDRTTGRAVREHERLCRGKSCEVSWLSGGLSRRGGRRPRNEVGLEASRAA